MPQRNATAHSAERNCEITVASAALYAHAQRKNKHRVQNDIHHSTQQYRDHAHAAEALGVDEIVHAKPQHHEHSAAQINGEVAVRIGESGITGAEQIQQRFFEREHQRREHKACAQQHGKGVAHNICGVGVVAPARAMEKSGAPLCRTDWQTQ